MTTEALGRRLEFICEAATVAGINVVFDPENCFIHLEGPDGQIISLPIEDLRPLASHLTAIDCAAWCSGLFE